MSLRVLITDSAHPLLAEGLQQLGYEVSYQPDITYATTLNTISQYHGLVINSKITVNAHFLSQAKQLRWVARLGSGLEIIDLHAAHQQGITVINSPEGNCDAVAEHAIAMLLALANQLIQADREVRHLQWNREARRGWELSGKTIGIIGYGHTGSALARRLAGFGVQVLAYDKYKKNYVEPAHTHVFETTMNHIFEHADIISFHLPLTSEVRGLADLRYWQQFRKPIVVINTARGAIINTSHLIKALQSGQVLGACLDVFEHEQVANWTPQQHQMYQQLYQLPQVVLTPHIAGWTVESKRKLATVLLSKISLLYHV